MSRQDFIDVADGFLIRADGLLVNQIIFEPYQVRLHLRYGDREEDAERSYQIILEAPFKLSSPDGGVVRLDPEGTPEALGPALALLTRAANDGWSRDASPPVMFHGSPP